MKRKDKNLLMECLGYEYVDVDYFGTEDETEWQKENNDWMGKVGISEVGYYYVNVPEDKWLEDYKIDFESDWNWVMRVVNHLLEQKTIESFDTNIDKTIKICLTALGGSIKPDFMGVVCKHCNKPFLVWTTKIAETKEDREEVMGYINIGHIEKEIDSSIVGNIDKWCSCQGKG